MAEGHGYYSYLLTSHIYNDPTFDFFNQLYVKYYCGGVQPPVMNFINEFDGIRVNKYYPGVSLLWMPFFLIAHLLSLLFGWTADGYSDAYQYAIGIAGIFYTGLGIHFTLRLMDRFRISFYMQALVSTTLLFGTNLLIYSGAWSSQTHAYSFFLIAAFSYYAFRLFDETDFDKNGALSILAVLTALIISVRPQCIAVVFLLPFYGATRTKLSRIMRENMPSLKFFFGMLLASLIIFRVVYYWHLQTGHWYLYPYHGESYDLMQPHVIDILFSYRKGWLLYSPFILFGLAGIIFFKSLKEKTNLFLFWFVLVYVSSCWWCWTYSQTSFGQRTFVDFYPLIGLQAGILFEKIKARRWFLIIPVACLLLILMNLLQTHQYRKGILDGDLCDRDGYFAGFFTVRPIANYPVPVSSILKEEEVVEDFDSKETGSRIIDCGPINGKCTFVSDSVIYSEGITANLPLFLDGSEFSHVRIAADIKSPKMITEGINLVIDLKRGDASFGYSAHPISPYIHGKEWTRVRFGMQVPVQVRSGDQVKVYGWKSGSEPIGSVYMDNLSVEFIQADSSYYLKKR
ncbi:MAG: hypothetical protein ACKOQ6_11705 [Bacteroidota bacterium]